MTVTEPAETKSVGWKHLEGSPGQILRGFRTHSLCAGGNEVFSFNVVRHFPWKVLPCAVNRCPYFLSTGKTHFSERMAMTVAGSSAQGSLAGIS